jgi:hypothetical protein
MKSMSYRTGFTLMVVTLVVLYSLSACKKTKNPIKYPDGIFPDSVYALEGLNSQYDDYNSNLFVFDTQIPIIFSSNRGSSGGQFDLVQGIIWYQFNQENGNFTIDSQTWDDIFYATIIESANTAGNDFGPFTIFGSEDDYEYLIVASADAGGKLDLQYEKYLPRYGSIAPQVIGPYPATRFNTTDNEAYISFDLNADSAYYCTDKNGDYDIYVQQKNTAVALDTWLSQSLAESSPVDSLNSSSDDKCPFVYRSFLVFASNRPGGLGGYDLYYSVFRNGKWSSPVNFGPRINSSSDEYRPVIGYNPHYINLAMVFSSNRDGGAGGFDLYFTGITFTDK